MKYTLHFLKSKKIRVFFIIPLIIIAAIYAYSILRPNSHKILAENNQNNSLEKDMLTINMAEVPHNPWNTEEAPVHVAETFTAAVHGSLTPIFELSSNDSSNQNTLLEKYFCEKNICYASLKKGILFHNKREVNAYDIEFSLTRRFLAQEGISYVQSILDNIIGIEKVNKENVRIIKVNNIEYPSEAIEGIKVKDNYNIVFNLKRPNKLFFSRISDGKIPIVPIEELESDYIKWKKYPIGFGKYKVTGADLADYKFYLQKVSEEEKIPKFVTILFGSGNVGDIKMLLGGPNRGIEEYERKVIFSNVYSNAGFLYNYQTELGKNENFRKAISLALDRHKIASASIFNEMLPEDQMFSDSGWQKEYRAKMPIQGQNTEEAKRLLSLVPEHLWKNKIFQVPTYWEDVKEINSLQYVNEIKAQLNEIGIQTNFLDTDTNYEKFRDGDKNVLWFTGFGFANNDPNKNFAHFRKGSYFTHEYPNDPKYERLYQKSVKNFSKSPADTMKLSEYFTKKNIMTICMVQRMSLSYDSRKVISLGNQYNGIRLAIWEIKLKE
jgi:ABC-type transport system substrate-binding protein